MERPCAGPELSVRPDLDINSMYDIEYRAKEVYREVTGLDCELDFYGDEADGHELEDLTADDACYYLETGEWPE